MKSSFFYNGASREVADRIKMAINSAPDFLSSLTASSPRAVGDAVQGLIEKFFEKAASEWCEEYSSAFARRAMADLAFKDKEGFYCIVDVKTHRCDASFSMPALVSVERLSRFYESDMNVFSILMVKYSIDGHRLQADEVIFCPIEFLGWDCLTIGALGWGQIQIANSNNISINHGLSRREWMLSFCEAMQIFYPREIEKISKRQERFDAIRSFWEQKEDIWR